MSSCCNVRTIIVNTMYACAALARDVTDVAVCRLPLTRYSTVQTGVCPAAHLRLRRHAKRDGVGGIFAEGARADGVSRLTAVASRARCCRDVFVARTRTPTRWQF